VGGLQYNFQEGNIVRMNKTRLYIYESLKINLAKRKYYGYPAWGYIKLRKESTNVLTI